MTQNRSPQTLHTTDKAIGCIIQTTIIIHECWVDMLKIVKINITVFKIYFTVFT